ncbi:MAG: hypothetical protein AB7U47_15125, partial [Variibacter sp.]
VLRRMDSGLATEPVLGRREAPIRVRRSGMTASHLSDEQGRVSRPASSLDRSAILLETGKAD